MCGVFAFSGCADYETDINNLNDRVDALETGRIADVEDQLASLQEALASAQSAIDAIEALNLEGLTQDLSDLKATVQEIESGLSDYATLEYVDATFATKDYVEELNTRLRQMPARRLERSTHSLTHSEYTPRPVSFRLLLTASWTSLTLTPSSMRLFRLLSTRAV